MKTRVNKFSNIDVDESDNGVYNALIKLVLKICWQQGDDNNIMMDGEELLGELLEEMAKGLKHYKNLPYEQKVTVIKRMFDNRISELRYKYYVTHRKAHITDISIEIELSDEGEFVAPQSEEPLPEDWALSTERVVETRDLLSNSAKLVFDSLVYGNSRLSNLILLHLQRSQVGGINPKIRPWMVADALLMDEKEVTRAFVEIRNAYQKVIND